MFRSGPFHVLLVDDESSDAMLTTIALQESGPQCQVHHCERGADALAFLRREGGVHKSAPRPDLVLLDLNMPGMTGLQVVAEMKSEKALRDIPVVILTTSDAQSDIQSCYHAGANTFITKPIDLNAFLKAMKCLQEYWFSLARLPPPDGAETARQPF